MNKSLCRKWTPMKSITTDSPTASYFFHLSWSLVIKESIHRKNLNTLAPQHYLWQGHFKIHFLITVNWPYFRSVSTVSLFSPATRFICWSSLLSIESEDTIPFIHLNVKTLILFQESQKAASLHEQFFFMNESRSCEIMLRVEQILLARSAAAS